MTRRINTSVDDEHKSRATVAQAKHRQAECLSVLWCLSSFERGKDLHLSLAAEFRVDAGHAE